MIVARRKSADKSTAYHEAGHAVVAWVYEVKLRRVTIVPDAVRGSHGNCWHDPLIKTADQFGDSERARLRQERFIKIALAGAISQRIACPRGVRKHHDSTDCAGIIDVVLNLTGSSAQAEAYIRYLKICTRELLANHWKLVEGLAEELIIRRTIDGEEVSSILQQLSAGRDRAA